MCPKKLILRSDRANPNRAWKYGRTPPVCMWKRGPATTLAVWMFTWQTVSAGEHHSSSGRLNENSWKSSFGSGGTGMSIGPPAYVSLGSMPRR